MNPSLLAVLRRDNPWLNDLGQLDSWLQVRLPTPFHEREILCETSRWKTNNRAHLVIGPRQAGKSTVIWAHLARLGKPAFYIDCEQRLVQQWCDSAPLFLEDVEGLAADPPILFFDEIQHLEEAGLFLKGLVDRGYGAPIMVTGSSSYHLRSRTRESLAGRATRSRLMPFSLHEVCGDLVGRAPLIEQDERSRRLERHIAFGGYPEVWLSDSPESVLVDLIESIILRDASDLYKIGRPDAFRRLLQLAARQSGSLVNLSEWTSILGVNRGTASAYLEILEESHVTVSLTPYVGGKRAELTHRPKIFLVDNGIRNQILSSHAPLGARVDAGPTLENWVFTELWKALPTGATLHYWRSTSGAEVDFVVAHADDLVAFEVKAQQLRRPSLPRSARSFIEAYSPQRFLVVNTGLEHEERLGDTIVSWVGPAAVAAERASG